MLYQKIDKNTAGYEKIRAELMALQSRINIILGIEGIKDWRITEKENLMHHFFPDEQLDDNQKVLLTVILQNSTLSDFSSFAIKSNRYVSRLDEIKRGIDEGFSLAEIMMILDLPQNVRRTGKELYMQNREYFNKLIRAGQIYKVIDRTYKKSDSNNLRIEDSDEKGKPVKKKAINTAEVENIPVFTGKASYIEYQRDDDPDKRWYRCISDDGETYDTPDQSVAAKWVDNKNIRMISKQATRRSDSLTR